MSPTTSAMWISIQMHLCLPTEKKLFLLQFFRDFYKYILNIIFYAFFVSKNFNFYYFLYQVLFFAAIKITHDYH